MNSAHGLASSEGVNRPRHSGIESGRHRETGPDHEWNQDKDDQQVSDALEHVVCAGLSFVRRCQAKVLRDHTANRAPSPVFLRWKQVPPEMACPQTGDDVDE